MNIIRKVAQFVLYPRSDTSIIYSQAYAFRRFKKKNSQKISVAAFALIAGSSLILNSWHGKICFEVRSTKKLLKNLRLRNI